MSNGLDNVPGTSKVIETYPSQVPALTLNQENIAKRSLLAIDRRVPSKSSSYQETANPCFDSLSEDYAQARLLYADHAMKGRGSKRLEGFPIILFNLKFFIKWIKVEAEQVAFEVIINRRIKYHEEHWTQAKQAFQNELDRINQQRQAKP